jgi:hypothetical protein
MFFVKIHYGLGNQMFQYALARRISIERQLPFKMDISFYSKNPTLKETKRTYDLNKFNIIENVATDVELNRFASDSILKRLSQKLERNLVPYYYRSIVREKGLSFDSNILKIRKGSYLHGYWQNEEYFKPVERILRKDFTFKFGPDQLTASLINLIKSKESAIAIHIRRGDYLTDKNILSVLYHCPQSYYGNAIEYIAKEVKNPFFFIFTDDPDWARDSFKIGYPNTLISGQSLDSPPEELRLMSSCKHFIIANSSFSWWAAWLGSSLEKIVIAPQQWYKNGTNIASPNWIKL